MLLDILTVDQAVEHIGFGWLQVKMSLFVGLVWVCNATVFQVFLWEAWWRNGYGVVGSIPGRAAIKLYLGQLSLPSLRDR